MNLNQLRPLMGYHCYSLLKIEVQAPTFRNERLSCCRRSCDDAAKTSHLKTHKLSIWNGIMGTGYTSIHISYPFILLLLMHMPIPSGVHDFHSCRFGEFVLCSFQSLYVLIKFRSCSLHRGLGWRSRCKTLAWYFTCTWMDKWCWARHVKNQHFGKKIIQNPNAPGYLHYCTLLPFWLACVLHVQPFG